MIEAKLQGFIKVLAVVGLGGGDSVMKGGLCHEGGIGACLTLYKTVFSPGFF